MTALAATHLKGSSTERREVEKSKLALVWIHDGRLTSFPISLSDTVYIKQ